MLVYHNDQKTTAFLADVSFSLKLLAISKSSDSSNYYSAHADI